MNKYTIRQRWHTIKVVTGAYMLFVAILLLIMCMLFSSCSPKVIHEKETVIEYKDRVVHDTATVEITKEVEKIVTRDTVSHLENRYAKSEAVVSEGFLTHSLESIPQYIKVPVEIHVTDTVKIEKEATTQIKEIKVEKELNWWQKFRLWAFLPLLLACGFAYYKTLIPLFTKLLNLIKLI